MQITITQAAKQYILTQYGAQPQRLLLDYLDGDSPFNEQAINCQLQDDFRLIALPEQTDEVKWHFYSSSISTSVGELYMKPQATTFLDAENVIDYDARYLSLNLHGSSGILVPRLPFIVIK